MSSQLFFRDKGRIWGYNADTKDADSNIHVWQVCDIIMLVGKATECALKTYCLRTATDRE